MNAGFEATGGVGRDAEGGGAVPAEYLAPDASATF